MNPKIIKYKEQFWQPVTLVDSQGVEIDMSKTSVQDIKIVGTTGNIAEVNETGQLKVVLDGKVCEENSTETPLLENGIFEGQVFETLDYALVFITLISDSDSAANGLQVLISTNGTDFYVSDEFTVLSNSLKTFSIQPNAKYFKIKYTNGAVAQSFFHLQTICKKTNSKPSSHRIQDEIVDDDDAELMKAVLTGKDNLNIFRNISSSQRGSLSVSLKEYQGDAFGRLRVSEPYTIFDNSLTTELSSLLFWSTLINGTATGTYQQMYSRYDMKVVANGDYIVRQTKQRFKYQPGKSHEILITGLFEVSGNNICKVGYLDYDNIGLVSITNAPQNGVCFTNNSGILSFCIYNNGVLTESVTQDNWNIDKCNGLGESSFNLDIESTNILFFDMEWLGVGAVRCGFVNKSGEIIVAHQFQHASNGFTDVYMRTANLPISYALTCGSEGVETTVKQICSSVISEGGFNPLGIITAVTSPTNVGISAGDTELICGIKLKNDSFSYTIEPTLISLFNVSKSNSVWYLCTNPTYSGSVAWSDLANSEVQVAYNNSNIVTDLGLILASGVFSNETSSLTSAIQTSYRIGKKLDGIVDELWLVVKATSSDNYYGSINFKQYI